MKEEKLNTDQSNNKVESLLRAKDNDINEEEEELTADQ